MRTRNILAALLLMAGIQTAWAQKVVLNYTDGTTQKVPVSELQDITFEEADGTDVDNHEYVDLGLPSGTLWATCNIGAKYPWDYGDYFAWGETSGYNSGKTTFDLDTYKYWDATYSVVTKYCTDSSSGTIDNKSELEAKDDAATVNWGTAWQMPSLLQFDELINSSYTTTTWTTLNGVYGRMIVSKSNGNRVFLPAAGIRLDASLYDAGSYGFYWSRSLRSSNSLCGYFLDFSSRYISTSSYYYRCYGQSVRPVRVK